MLNAYIKTSPSGRELPALRARANHYAPQSKRHAGPSELAILRAILDRRPYPVFVMDAALTVCLKNDETESRGKTYGLTVIEGKKLSLSDVESGSRLKRLVRTMAMNIDEKYACEVFSYDFANGQSATLSLSRIEPVPNADGCTPNVLFMVSARRTLGSVEICADRLVATFGLTKAEASLCASIAQNVSLQEYAGREGIKVTTARWHLQNVFERTGVNSQTELVAMIVSVML